jgi:hypothetical protein
MNIYKKMKDIIRKILREEKSLTPKFDYYKKVAEMIVDRFIEIDHENRIIYFPFSGGYGRRESFDGGLTDYVQKTRNELDNSTYKDFPTYLQHMFGLDVQDKRGIMMVIMKLIKKHLNKRMKNEKHN